MFPADGSVGGSRALIYFHPRGSGLKKKSEKKNEGLGKMLCDYILHNGRRDESDDVFKRTIVT